MAPSDHRRPGTLHQGRGGRDVRLELLLRGLEGSQIRGHEELAERSFFSGLSSMCLEVEGYPGSGAFGQRTRNYKQGEPRIISAVWRFPCQRIGLYASPPRAGRAVTPDCDDTSSSAA